MLLSIEFKMADESVEILKVSKDVSEPISITCGLFFLIYSLCSFVVKYINFKHLEAKAMRSLYFMMETKPEGVSAKTLKFDIFEKLIPLKETILSIIFCCSKKKMGRKLDDLDVEHLNLVRIVDEDLNLFKLVQTVNKLKSAVQVLLKND
jgi:hypothetical protein